MLGPLVGQFATTNVWPVSDRAVLATAGQYLYRSSDEGASWRHVHTLPEASGPMGALPTSVCAHDGHLYLAEYTLDDGPARILRSDDDGANWTVHLRSDDHRHFHGVFHDPYGDRLWATAGDEDTESAVGVLDDGGFRPVGAGSQRWRAVGLAFTPDAVIWGMDCSYAPEIEILSLPRGEIGSADPDPIRIGTTDASVFFAETLQVNGDHWVVIATAAETGRDSTAPPGAEHTSGSRTRVLASSAEGNFDTWHELYSFERRRPVGEWIPGVPTASAYVYLTVADRHVVVNPFNTARHHGDVLTRDLTELLDRSRREEADAIR